MNRVLLSVAATVGAISTMYAGFDILPKAMKPASVQMVEQAVAPIAENDKYQNCNFAIRNIPYLSDRICKTMNEDNVDLDQLNTDTALRKLEYRTHRENCGMEHRYQSMNDKEICDERNE